MKKLLIPPVTAAAVLAVASIALLVFPGLRAWVWERLRVAECESADATLEGMMIKSAVAAGQEEAAAVAVPSAPAPPQGHQG